MWVEHPARSSQPRANHQVDFSNAEWVYAPIIQSGGNYDLKVSAVSDNKPLKPGVILSSLAIRYKSYCTSMGRTFMINPNKVCTRLLATLTLQKQESYYSILLEARGEALKLLKAGAVASEVYEKVRSFVEGKSATLAQTMLKSMGFVVSGMRVTRDADLLSDRYRVPR